MKSVFLALLILVGLKASAQTENTLLWRIWGNGLKQPSYLFGTIHALCAGDLHLSDSLKSAIRSTDRVYLELDLDNMLEMVGALKHMKMRNDTTLQDLLSAEEYHRVKAYFNKKGGVLPFAMVETYKPMLSASTLMQEGFECSEMISMEQLIMKEAKGQGKGVRGLETMAFQLSIFDSIPYSLQARQLLEIVDSSGSSGESLDRLSNAYRNQRLDSLELLTREESEELTGFNELLLYRRNENWVKKLQELLPERGLLVAVGAGHLPGTRGLIGLLRARGYRVEPVANDMTTRPTRML